MNPFYKNLALWLVITLMMIMLYNLFNQQKISEANLSYTEFLSMVDAGRVSEVTIQGQELFVTNTNGDRFKVFSPQDSDLIGILRKEGVSIKAKPPAESPWYMSVLVSWFPMLLLIGVWIFFMRQMQSGGGKALSFGKSRARLLSDQSSRVTFADVAGIDEAKEELGEIVEFLKEPKKFTRLGGRIPKGVLLMGPPGTGKTLLARAIAGEAGVPFFSISGSDFVEMFVGVGASRVRDLFVQGKKNAPCIIFIDEIDAVGRHRGAGLGGGHDEREQTLNQLLAEMDGFDSSKGVVILAATNRPEVLDKALLRPGRFDRRVIVDRPDLKGREDILKVHIKGVKISHNVDLNSIAKATPGAVGADLANIINEAALTAVKNRRNEVEQNDLEEAVEVIIAGKEKKDRILSEKEKMEVSFHEVGHALIAALLKHTDPVHKITIVPRTMGALGYTMQLPEHEKYLNTKEEMLDQICVMLGGRSAEEVKFSSISTGAANDIERATQTARSMVTMYGMSDKFDMMGLESIQNRYLDGRPVRNCSAETSTIIDNETLKIIKKAHEKAKGVLLDNIDLLNKIANTLIEKETLMGDEFMAMVHEYQKENGKEITVIEDSDV